MLSNMAFCKLIFTGTVTWLFFLFISPSHAASSGSNIGYPEKVNLSLYYETLNPNCSNFIVQKLTTVFANDLISIINLRLVPWGNAFIDNSSKKIVCKHGPEECMLNTVEACAINVWNDNLNKYYGFIYCIEFLAIEGRHKDWSTCFENFGLTPKPILDCYNGGNGTEFSLQYANETAHLIPPGAFVPWLVVNNQPIREDYGNFTSYVCNAYKGSVVPNACKNPLPGTNLAKEASPAKTMSRFKHALQEHQIRKLKGQFV
ncbi:gamma-interferon-responsive lysosomal thiol protein-like [Mangifera indica]|uniref:gamma-interferon-responsive lysosomal thiol protein-like n=1 Tax=Mangifera indica TaxID=29780 RepID=UPI001CF952D5|nr:gamma-interferon-responsive lysosomal thiol protein-like [Mangifera indica]